MKPLNIISAITAAGALIATFGGAICVLHYGEPLSDAINPALTFIVSATLAKYL